MWRGRGNRARRPSAALSLLELLHERPRSLLGSPGSIQATDVFRDWEVIYSEPEDAACKTQSQSPYQLYERLCEAQANP